MLDMGSAWHWARELQVRAIGEGARVIDATMGGGGDTQALCELVGESGRVYAFDIQPEALESTGKHLRDAGAPENYTLICASHHLLRDYVHEPIKAGIFNLGYLPRSGKKGTTTMRETTMAAVSAAMDILLPDGALLIAIYPGHKEGELEGDMLRDYFSTLSRFVWCASEFRIRNSPESPYFFLLEKSARAKPQVL